MSLAAERELLMAGGAKAEAAGHVRDALIRYEAAVKLAPADALTHLRLGTICHRLRDYARAREILSTALDLDAGNAEIAFRLLNASPEQPEVLAELGSLLWETGNRDDAFPYLERAAQACPSDPALILQLGLAHAARQERAVARKLLTQAKHLDPSDQRIDLALKDLGRPKKRDGLAGPPPRRSVSRAVSRP